jgi:hypothetical protein
VEILLNPAWTISAPNPTVTGADGTASWQVVCGQPGPQPLNLLLNGTNNYPLNVPACNPPPATTVPTTSSTIAGTTTTPIT